jgi:UDP-N-acetylglucosamine transferase subunit ALG13
MVTVGGQMPFDRLIRTVDALAQKKSDMAFFAQIGHGGWRPQHMEWAEMLNPIDLRAKFQASTLIVAHAGMGTILTALDMGKKIVVLPRRGDLHETRNDHQIATAARLSKIGLIPYASNETELIEMISDPDSIISNQSESCFASPDFIESIRTFILSV